MCTARARLPARRIRLAFRSDFEDDAPLRLAVSAYDREAGVFPAVSASWPLAGRKGRPAVFEAGFDFLSDRLYRIEIESPSFVPDETLGNGDTRRLGLAVYSISIGTPPASRPEPAPGR